MERDIEGKGGGGRAARQGPVRQKLYFGLTKGFFCCRMLVPKFVFRYNVAKIEMENKNGRG